MERMCAVALVLLIVAGTGVVVAGEQRGVISAEYAVPLDGSVSDSNVQTAPGAVDTLNLGLAVQFWRIFYGSVHLYSEVVYGAENRIGVAARPMGLFSAGVGLEIPIAGPYLILDWQRLFTIPSAPHEGISRYGGLMKIGMGFRLLENWRVHVFSRSVNIHAEYADDTVDYGAPIIDLRPRFSSIGIGTSIRF
jgi:hypothetical protein